MTLTEDNGQLTIELEDVYRLRRIEEAARAAVRYHVLGYDAEPDWSANHMLHLLDQLAKVLEE